MTESERAVVRLLVCIAILLFVAVGTTFASGMAEIMTEAEVEDMAEWSDAKWDDFERGMTIEVMTQELEMIEDPNERAMLTAFMDIVPYMENLRYGTAEERRNILLPAYQKMWNIIMYMIMTGEEI